MPLSYMNYKLQTVFVLLFFHPEEPARSLRFYRYLFYFFIYAVLYRDRSILRCNRDYDFLQIYMCVHIITFLSKCAFLECTSFIKNRSVFDIFIH